MKKYLLILILIAFGLIALLIWGGIWSGGRVDPKLEAFAKCLAEKNIAMYGAYWCPSCKEEKAAFGSAFKYVNYFECSKDPKKCLALGIEYFPTWIFPDPPATTSSGDVGRGGKKLIGYQGLEKLAQESGCELPK